MQITLHNHLSYCTNIHPGESWQEVFHNLKTSTHKIHQYFGIEKPFGIGLRLSALAAETLLQNSNLSLFKNWLSEKNNYVFTLNGFPYGAFHGKPVKDKVHAPDWTTPERVFYTKNLFRILSELIPQGASGSISTSPLSYKHWYSNTSAIETVKQKSCRNFVSIISDLFYIKEKTGQHLHLDIEPEPDGIIETSDEWVYFFRDYLLSEGVPMLAKQTGISISQAESAIRDHIQLCHDICHFAVGFEDPIAVIKKMEYHGIGIGKLQISAALKSIVPQTKAALDIIRDYLSNFDEPTYLHQAVLKSRSGKLERFKDLKPALYTLNTVDHAELRTHFHVPVFTENYQTLQSTQDDILKTLNFWKKYPFTKHLEVETYTWDVLPEALKMNIHQSICRELNWVIKTIEA